MREDRTNITRFKIEPESKCSVNDVVVIEEPLQIELLHNNQLQTYSITMRTPGNDQYLAYGLLFSENVISHASDIESITNSTVKEVVEANLLTVKIVASIALNLDDQARRLASYSGCGICGKTSLKALNLKNPRQPRKLQLTLSCSDILKAREILSKQPLFSGTGGSHVAGVVYETNADETSVYETDADKMLGDEQARLDFVSAKCFEDVGRHNALDKLIGFELVDNNLSKPGVVILSGRVGFELVQKVVMAGYSTIIALGAPSSLAIKTANQFGLTLIGFAKDEQYNLYTF
ncbi:MAG: hypothetical protein COA86_15250 [Kangiella sp.]|nr:MAG: hypothetical protein COA86_15250 [Kangiella sp.]